MQYKYGHELLARAAFSFVVALAGVSLLEWSASSQAATNSETNSLAVWGEIASVLQHPRCLNCHQPDSPLQGDSRRVHLPRVQRGFDNRGVSAMRCANCHIDSGNSTASGAPGAPQWQLAPKSMSWQGLSAGDLCRLLKDPRRNGMRTPEALIAHVAFEPLVLWSWSPGAGREPIPMQHDEFVNHMKTWVAGGAVCPK